VSGIDLASRLGSVAAAVEAELDRLLPLPCGPEAPLLEAMRHAVLGGGKRFRAFLVHAVGGIYGADPAATLRVGAAVELLHAYSLVHDDLPAMDDAELRRGRPTVHRAFGEATAILAGDALQALAFEVLTRRDWPLDDARRVELVAGLAAAAGAAGMCAGQAIDLLAERTPLDLEATTRLHRLKTGALIRFCVEAGCLLGDAPEGERAILAAWADALGLAFQIRDDLLDATAATASLGKDAGRDAAAGKSTFVTLLGVAGASRELARLRDEAARRLAGLPRDSGPLHAIFDWVTMRTA
jgi:farnesyl diphosphate synthase